MHAGSSIIGYLSSTYDRNAGVHQDAQCQCTVPQQLMQHQPFQPIPPFLPLGSQNSTIKSRRLPLGSSLLLIQVVPARVQRATMVQTTEIDKFPWSNRYEPECRQNRDPNIHWHFQRGEWQNINAHYLMEQAKLKDVDDENDKDPEMTQYIRTRRYDELLRLVYFGPRSWGSPTRNLTDKQLNRIDDSRKPWLVKPNVGLPRSSSGILDRLPNETMANIIQYTDLASIDALMLMNRRLFHAVWDHGSYKLLMKHVYGILVSIRATKSGRNVPMDKLISLLYTKKCQRCHDAFGCYIYLLTLERLCNVCMENGKEYTPMREYEAVKEYGLTLEMLETLPRLRVQQGCYGDWGYELWTWVVDRYSCRDLARKLHDSDEGIREYANSEDGKALRGLSMKKVRQRDLELRHKLGTRRPPCEHARSSCARQTRTRYTVIVRAPWLHPERKGEAIWGFRCLGCHEHQVGPFHCDIEYTMEEFMEHLREAGEIDYGVHHWKDCCQTRKCFQRWMPTERFFGSYEYPYWNV